jgi:CBS domain-containing protein
MVTESVIELELPVRIRETSRDDREQSFTLSVYCPRRRASETVDDCVRCEWCQGLMLDPRDDAVLLRCLVPRATQATPAIHPEPVVASENPSLADRTPVGAIMRRDVVCVDPDLGVDSLMALMLSRGISGAPVVDAEGKPVGVVSKTDVIRACHENGGVSEVDRQPFELGGERLVMPRGSHLEPTAIRVREIMMPITFTLTESAPVARAAALMAFEGVHRLVVVSMTGTVVGIVSSLDVLSWLAAASGYVVPR